MRISMSLKVVAVASLIAGFAGVASAGYVATTNANVFAYSGPGTASAPQLGGTLTLTNGTFAQYQPDGPGDPQITGGDLGFYKLTLNLAVTQAPTATKPARFSGSYKIFYDSNLDAVDSGFNPGAGALDAQVSAGTATLNFNTFGLPAFAFESGIFQQSATGGPQPGTALRDLSYGGLIGVHGGIYLPASNTLQFAITVPEPTTLASLAAVTLLGRRRRRA